MIVGKQKYTEKYEHIPTLMSHNLQLVAAMSLNGFNSEIKYPPLNPGPA